MKILLLLSKFEVGITFIPFIIVILFSGSYKLFFTYFLITFIHELGHVITACIFKVKVNNIKLSAFGFNANIGEIDYLHWLKQVLIIIMGPLTFFISAFVIRELYLNDVISIVMYYKAIATNKYILLFNILPIYPLDGGRLIKVVLDKLLTYKKSKIVLYILSFVFMIGFVFYTMECKQYLMYIFLVISFIFNVVNLNKEWKTFLIRRYYFSNNYKEKIHGYNDLYIYKKNYLLVNKQLLNEKEAIVEFLKN